VFPGQLGKPREIGHFQGRVADGFRVDDPCLRRDGLREGRQVVRGDKGCLDPHLGECAFHQGMGSAIDGITGDDMPALGTQL